MAGRGYKGKRSATVWKHVQLLEWFQSTEAWATLKPGPRALYIELKRRHNGFNNGSIVLSHRDAAQALNVNRNTVGQWFAELEARGFIRMTRQPYLGSAGVGMSAHWALEELPLANGTPATKTFAAWRENKTLAQKTGHPVPKNGTPCRAERPKLHETS